MENNEDRKFWIKIDLSNLTQTSHTTIVVWQSERGRARSTLNKVLVPEVCGFRF